VIDVIAHGAGGLLARAYVQSDAYAGEIPNTSLTLPEFNELMLGICPFYQIKKNSVAARN
jgi:hypothetical protein